MPVPSSRFALLVAASSVGLFFWPGRSWTLLWVVEAVLVLVFVADAFAGVSPKQIRVFRDHPDAVTLGETATLTWVLENHARTSSRVTVTDAVWPSLRATRRSVTVRLGGRARHVATAELWPSRRGRFPLDDVTVRVASPMGLATRHRTRSVPTTLRVLPAFPSRDELQRRMRQPRIIDVGLRTLRVRGNGTDFDQLRELRPGDDSRRIDWAATARSQRPIVRQFRAERNQSVVILLDNGRIMAGSVGGVPRVEHGMDAALGLTTVATHLGDRVGLVTFDRNVRTVVPPGQSRTQASRVAEVMYLLEPELSESAYLAAFTYATARFRRRSLYVVLTDLVESAIEEAILPALPILSRRHLVVVAAVQDPEMQAWAEHSPTEPPAGSLAGSPGESTLDDGTAPAAFRQAAAIALVQQRRRSSARLAAAGAIVVDAAPGQLATRLVDTYLELKASGRL
ncbi:MAG: hypothetical protein JWM34_4510 [Ilumatobacteraceae bacterium]|nr:hypothetical protein [Ilumatobacteraceae bacterium]